MELWKTVCEQWDWILFWLFVVHTVVLRTVFRATVIWLSVPLVEDPSETHCTSVCTYTTVCTNCTTVCNRVYNNGFCRPVDLLHIVRNKSTETGRTLILDVESDLLHIVRNKSTEIIFLSTHFNVTTYEAIPTHVLWNASDFAAVVVVIAVLIGVIVIIHEGINHWSSIVAQCKLYYTLGYAKNAMLCVTCLTTIWLGFKVYGSV